MILSILYWEHSERKAYEVLCGSAYLIYSVVKERWQGINNMREKLEYDMYIVDRAVEAMKEKGVEPIIQPIRGGTDGARLSFMGLLCPNLSTGGHNFHGKYEYICIQSMDK